MFFRRFLLSVFVAYTETCIDPSRVNLPRKWSVKQGIVTKKGWAGRFNTEKEEVIGKKIFHSPLAAMDVDVTDHRIFATAYLHMKDRKLFSHFFTANLP